MKKLLFLTIISLLSASSIRIRKESDAVQEKENEVWPEYDPVMEWIYKEEGFRRQLMLKRGII